MSNRAKNLIYSLILLTAVIAVWFFRQNSRPEPIRIEGQTMATTYHVTYFDAQGRNFSKSVDSLLVLVNLSINTYDPESEISLFNQSPRGIAFQLPYLLPPLQVAARVTKESNGAFDPTVMPLVNAWGFGPAIQELPDSADVDSLRVFVGFEKVRFDSDSIWKLDNRTQLDFGGIGQGYGADVIADFLSSRGITSFLVELGGEGVASGINLNSRKPWSIGILDPQSTRDNQFFKAYVKLDNKSFTTSGNYFNYREVDGQRFSHTIDPQTGYPANKEILSASVFAQDCTTADAWATAFMVMGHEQAMMILKAHTELDAFLIYSTPQGIATFATAGISDNLEINQ